MIIKNLNIIYYDRFAFYKSYGGFKSFYFKPIAKDLKAFRSVVLKLQRRVILNQLVLNHKRWSILVKFHNKFLENYLGDVV